MENKLKIALTFQEGGIVPRLFIWEPCHICIQ